MIDRDWFRARNFLEEVDGERDGCREREGEGER